MKLAKLESSARLFAALGDKTRLHIVARLCNEGPLSITDLASGADITRQAITKHLDWLEAEDLVKPSKRGRQQIYQLEIKRLQIAADYIEMVSNRWDSALDRLKSLVEER